MDTEASNPYASPVALERPTRPFFRLARFWIPAVVCLLAISCVPVAFIIGLELGRLQGNEEVYYHLASHQQSRMEAFLRKDFEAFGDLKVSHASDGWAYLSGTVNTRAEFNLLSTRLHEMFGDELAERMMRGVRVR